MQIMSDSQFQYTFNQNQFQNNYGDGSPKIMLGNTTKRKVIEVSLNMSMIMS